MRESKCNLLGLMEFRRGIKAKIAEIPDALLRIEKSVAACGDGIEEVVRFQQAIARATSNAHWVMLVEMFAPQLKVAVSVKAETGEMSMLASDAADAFEDSEALFGAIAAKLCRLGDQAGQGSTVKMINQPLPGVHIAAAGEAMPAGIKAGADPEKLYEVICNSAGGSWIFQNRVAHILAGDYTPLSAAAPQTFLRASAAGHSGEDDSAVIKAFPGIDLPLPKSARERLP